MGGIVKGNWLRRLERGALLASCVHLSASALLAFGQGTILFDQQSSTNESTPVLRSGVTIQPAEPYGQSFIPSSDALTFIRLKLNDNGPGNGLGATLHINLLSNSISGTVLGSTASIALSDSLAGVVTFYFNDAISITPGASYVFRPVVETGDFWNVEAGEYNYSRGTAIYQGSALSGSDLWFREGIVIPEPSTALLSFFGIGVLIHARRFGKKSAEVD